jgi:hypothetical protein
MGSGAVATDVVDDRWDVLKKWTWVAYSLAKSLEDCGSGNTYEEGVMRRELELELIEDTTRLNYVVASKPWYEQPEVAYGPGNARPRA